MTKRQGEHTRAQTTAQTRHFNLYILDARDLHFVNMDMIKARRDEIELCPAI